jgi:hypothetical protein
MSWDTGGRTVAEPLTIKVNGSATVDGAEIVIAVDFQIAEYPLKEKGPLSLIPQPSRVSAKLEGREVRLGWAVPKPLSITVRDRSSRSTVEYCVSITATGLAALEAARKNGSIGLGMTLAAQVVQIAPDQGRPQGISVEVAVTSFEPRVPKEDWEKLVSDVGEGKALVSLQERDQDAERLILAMNEKARAAEEVLAAVRQVAAEQGVSQQAGYFEQESSAHDGQAKLWLKRVTVATAGLSIFAVSTLFLHKIPWLAPSTPAEAVQFGIGKMLLFATIAYSVVLCARNYMAHRHNAIVNKHRQNSLATFRALVEAGGDQANRDIVLTRAAESIFGQVSTGFTKHDSDDGKALSLVNVGATAMKSSGS